MKKILLIFFLAFSIVNAKEELDWIVFGSGISGKPGSNVELMDSLVIEEEIDTIRELIFSDNAALKCLSAIILELFEEEDIVDLDEKEKLQINIIMSSFDKIYYYFGCNDDATILTIPEFLRFHKKQTVERYSYFIDEFY